MGERDEPMSDRYVDQNGKRWYCANQSGRVVCHSDDGYMTAADFPTFRKWGWQPASHLARPTEEPQR